MLQSLIKTKKDTYFQQTLLQIWMQQIYSCPVVPFWLQLNAVEYILILLAVPFR